MPQVSETIPGTLQPRVDAALAWFNVKVSQNGAKSKGGCRLHGGTLAGYLEFPLMNWRRLLYNNNCK